MAVQARKNKDGRVTSHRVAWRLNGSRSGAWQTVSLGATKGHAKQARALDAWLRDVHGYALTKTDPRIDEFLGLGATPTTTDEPADDEPAPTVREVVTAWASVPKRQRKFNTKRANQGVVKLLGTFGDMPARDVRAKHVEAWFAALDAGVGTRGGVPAASSSQQRRLAVLRSALKAHAHDGAFDTVSYPDERRVNRDKALTPSQVGDLIANATNNGMALALRVGAECGLRPSELCGLIANNVDLDARRIHVVAQLSPDNLKSHGFTLAPPKHGSARSVPMSDELADALALVRELPADAPVFTHDDGDYWSYQQWLKAWRKLVAATPSVPSKITPHALRHTAAIAWLIAGAPLGVVGKWLGHRNYKVTDEAYGQFSDEQEAAIMARVGLNL